MLMVALDKIWGHHRVGLCLVNAHLEDATVSAIKIADDSHLHRDTVLRHLKELEEAGRVVSVRKGRHICYKPTKVWAERTLQKIARV